MVVKTVNDNVTSSKYILSRKAGRSIIERRPIFSPNRESVIIIVENIVRVYNIKTGDCARILEPESSVNELIAVEFPPNEEYNLCGCSDDGHIITWTWENGAVLRENKLQISEDAKVLAFNLIDNNECLITTVDSAKKFISLNSYSIKTGELLREYPETTPQYFDIIRVSLGWCNGDRFAAVTNGSKYLYIQNLFHPHIHSQIISYNKFRILNVAAHPKESTVAITDTLGRLTLIRGNLYEKKTAVEVLHWHFLPLFAVEFSLQGNYLISGGMEKVLVKWTLGNLAHKVNEKQFIPRLPGFIKYIAANNSHIAITLSNNSVVIANAQMRVVSTILECGGLSAGVHGGANLVHVPSLSALLLPGRPGYLQLYSTVSDKVLYDIDITEKNSIPSERYNLLPLETEVTCTAVSANGTWLVTSEYRNDGVNYPEEKLKFWEAQTNATSPFKLNTCVNLSHGGCNVVSLALNKEGDFCVSSGMDLKFRIWKREDISAQDRKKVQWNCLTACYYSSGLAHFLSTPVLNNFKMDKDLAKDEKNSPYLKEYKHNKYDLISNIFNIHKKSNVEKVLNSQNPIESLEMGGVAISQDGSLIAAWFGCKLTLWDTHLCNLRTTLSHPALRPKGIHVQFGNNDAAHYLACTSESCLAVWSLLSLTVKWMVQMETTCLVADPFSNKMAVATTNNDVYVFSPHNSKPILAQKNLLDPETGVFEQCVFGAAVGDDIRLYVMRNDSEMYCLEPEASEVGPLEAVVSRRVGTSKFGALLAERALTAVRPAPTADLDQLDGDHLTNTATQILSGAPHMMPPVSVLCPLFLQQLLGSQPVEEAAQEDEPMDVDQPSSDDEEQKVDQPPKPSQLWASNYEHVKRKRLKKIFKEPFLDTKMTCEMLGV